MRFIFPLGDERVESLKTQRGSSAVIKAENTLGCINNFSDLENNKTIVNDQILMGDLLLIECKNIDINKDG